MNKTEIQRLMKIEERVGEICRQNGFETTTINFEIVTAERMIEALVHKIPTNFSHWSFGRDFERIETLYRHSGHGIPYEMVWNFKNPTALLVDTNPFALNVLIIAHVFAHVDFNQLNIYMKRGLDIGDVLIEARAAKRRFLRYEKLYGQDEVEKVIDAAMSFQNHQNPDYFSDPMSEHEMRQRCLNSERGKLKKLKSSLKTISDSKELEKTNLEIVGVQKRLEFFSSHTPPVPEYDILKYLLEKSSKMKKAWIYDIVDVIRRQRAVISPVIQTSILNEGWATYWHVRILRQVAREKLITPAECEQAIKFHAEVTQKSRKDFNVYSVGLAFWEMIHDKWDKGKFGPDWDRCRDRYEKDNWDKKLMQGDKKIFELRKILCNRMAIDNYFDDDFIRQEELYLWKSEIDKNTKEEIFTITQDNPEAIRQILSRKFGSHGPLVAVVDGNYNNNGELFLKHYFSGSELDPKNECGALEKLYFFWRKTVHLSTYEMGEYDEGKKEFQLKELIHSYNIRGHNFKKV